MKRSDTRYNAPLDTDMHVRLSGEQRAKLDEYARQYCGENVSYALRKALEIGLQHLLADDKERGAPTYAGD